MSRRPGRSFAAAVATLALIAGGASCVPTAPTGTLTPAAGRITDEAIAQDMALLRSWGERLGRVSPQATGTGRGAYSAAKARAWLAFASDEYQDNDRGGIIEAAFEQATSAIERLEAGLAVVDGDAALPRGVRLVREDLWEAVRRFKAHERFDLVAADVGLLEVTLIRAGHSGAPGAACSTAPHEARADSLAKEIEAALRAVPPVVTPPVPPPVVPLPPPADRDQDGVPDSRDCCPTSRPGAVVNADGCESLPAENVPLVLEGVNFETDRFFLRPGPRSVLDGVADILNARADIDVEISGHTDSIGSATYNQLLSARRAAAVREYLVSRGVRDTRITSVGEGEARPIDDNGTAAGRARNRRVELVWRRPERTEPMQPTCQVPADSLAPILPPVAGAPPLVLEGVQFATGSAELIGTSQRTLERVAAGLRAHPDVTVVVSGHTDSVGQPEANRMLSLDRAAAVSAYLAELGIAAGRLEARGYGAERPRATNATAEGRALNRRVELQLIADADRPVAGAQPGDSLVGRPDAVPGLRPGAPRPLVTSGLMAGLPQCEPPEYEGAACVIAVPAGGFIAVAGPEFRAGTPGLSDRNRALLDAVAYWMMWTWSDFLRIQSANPAWNAEVRRYLIERGVEPWRLLVELRRVPTTNGVELRQWRAPRSPDIQW